MSAEVERPTGIKGWGVAKGQLTSVQRWLSLVSMMITGLAVVFIVMKWNPILAIVGAEYGMDMSSIGNITGLALLIGCVVCFPSIWIMRTIGVKFTLALTIVITLVGSIGSLMVSSAAAFLVCRVIEGCGMGMLAAVGPNIVPRLFPLDKMGLAMGVWSQWTLPGLLVAIIFGSRLFVSTGASASITYLGIGLLVVALIMHVILFKLCAVDENVLNDHAAQAQVKTAINRSYVRGGIICAACFFGYCWCYGLCQGFYPTFLQSIGMDIVASNNPGLVASIVSAVSGILCGVLYEKLPCRKIAAVGGLIVFGGLVVLAYNTYDSSSSNAILYIVGIGFLAGVVPVAIRTYIPFLVTDPKKMDYILGIMAFVTNLTFFGNGLFGMLIAKTGFFNAATMFIGIPLLVCALLILFFVKSDRKIAKEEKAAAQQ